MNTTLSDVQKSVESQLIRDYTRRNTEDVLNMCYMGLGEEVGEVLGLRKRSLRDKFGDASRCTQEKYIEEMGDVLWYLAACCAMQHTSLEAIWEYNVNKLNKRYDTNGKR